MSQNNNDLTQLDDTNVVDLPASTGAEPVAWLVGQESLRGTIPNSMVFLTHSVLLHTREPQTTNPVWPLYAHPPALDEALRRDAARYRGVRRVANSQGYSDEEFDLQTDARVAAFDKGIAQCGDSPTSDKGE